MSFLDARQMRHLTGHIAWRLWVAGLVIGGAGAAFLHFGLGFGMVLVTLAALIAPLAIVFTLAFILRRPANRVPTWMTWAGGLATVAAVVWLLIDPGTIPATLTFAVGVWLFVVGLISAVAVGAGRTQAS